jgi:tetratricopeptide (TPR) repeat protein
MRVPRARRYTGNQEISVASRAEAFGASTDCMIRSARVATVFLSFTLLLPAQTPDKAGAYYNFTLGRLYAELASAYGNRGEYYNRAIEHYKAAIKLDPGAQFLLEELTDLYVEGNQLKSAIAEAEELLRQNPDNLGARRMLGRIYTRSIGGAQGRVNEDMLKKAIEQYAIVTAKDPKDMESWLTLGRLHRGAKNSPEAEKAFQKALELDPNSEDALTGLAMVYSDVGDTRKMIEMLKRVTDRSPNERALATLGAAYEEMRDFAAAAEVFQRALAIKPDNIQLKRALAQNLMWSGQFDESLKLFTEIAAAEPRDAQTQIRLAELHRRKGAFDKAREAITKARELDRNGLEARYEEVNLLDAEGKSEEAINALQAILDETVKRTYTAGEKASRMMLLERLAELYRDSQQTAKAVETMRQIGELDPATGPRVAATVVDTYRAARNYTSALSEADAALKKYPNERVVKIVHASVLADMGKVDAAAEEVRGLLGGPRDRETYLTLAQIYDKGKRFDQVEKALAEAERLTETKDDKERLYFTRGAMYEKQKKYDAAEAEFRKVIASDPANANALNYLGYMFADRGVKLEEAYELIRKAVDLDPLNGAYLDSLGWVYYRMDKLEEAEKYLRASLDRVSGDPTVHDHLGDVYLKRGKVQDAITQWQLSLKEWEKTPEADRDPAQVSSVTKKIESARTRLARERSGAKPQ